MAGGQGFESPQLHFDSRFPNVVRTGSNEFRNHFGYYLERAAAGAEIHISRRRAPVRAPDCRRRISSPQLHDLTQPDERPVKRGTFGPDK